DGVYPSFAGGVEQRNYQLARALSRRGHRVTLAGWFDEAPDLGDGIELLRLRPQSSFHDEGGHRTVGAALRLARDAARVDLSRYDVVETANIQYAHIPVLAMRAALARRPLV